MRRRNRPRQQRLSGHRRKGDAVLEWDKPEHGLHHRRLPRRGGGLHDHGQWCRQFPADRRQVPDEAVRWSQAEVAPGLEAVIRIAQVFNVTVDYLLIDAAERRPLNAPSNHADARLADLDQLSDDERNTITNVIDALVTKAKLRILTSGAS